MSCSRYSSRSRYKLCTLLLASVGFIVTPALHAQVSFPILGNQSSTNPLERTLASRVSLDVGAQTIGEFAGYLRQKYSVNVLVDHRALDDVGLGSDTELSSFAAEGVQLEEAISIILERVDLCLVVRDVVLIITTPEEAENQLDTHVYPVGDVLSWGGVDRRFADYDTLIEAITSTIAPDTWDSVGGAGAIEPFPYSQSLVISQTRQVHRHVQALIKTLRQARKGQPAPPLMTPSNANVGSVPYRPGTTPGSWSQPVIRQGGFF